MSWKRKFAIIKSLKADVWSVNPSSERLEEPTLSNSFNRSDDGLTLKTSAFKLFTVANLRSQLSWQH